jgi:hypothetical protein
MSHPSPLLVLSFNLIFLLTFLTCPASALGCDPFSDIYTCSQNGTTLDLAGPSFLELGLSIGLTILVVHVGTPMMVWCILHISIPTCLRPPPWVAIILKFLAGFLGMLHGFLAFFHIYIYYVLIFFLGGVSFGCRAVVVRRDR